MVRPSVPAGLPANRQPPGRGRRRQRDGATTLADVLGSGLPLSGVRVLDLAGSDADEVGRLFADLGADVLKIEPPAGSPARAARPAVAGIGVRFALHNANKRSAILDPDDDADRRTFAGLVSAADILVDSGIVGRAAAFGASCAELARRFGHLVALS